MDITPINEWGTWPRSGSNDNSDDKQEVRFSLTERRVSMNGCTEWKTLGAPHSPAAPHAGWLT